MRISQAPTCIWLMGLSGAGKTTLAKAIKPNLDQRAGASVLLDGDELRSGLCSGLGFDKDSRLENIRRCAEAAKLIMASGCNVIVSCITPYEIQRELIQQTLSKFELNFVHLSASLAVCEQRDTKGLYKKYREQGPYPLTGKGDPFEPLSVPALDINTGVLSVEQSVNAVLDYSLAP